MRNRALLGNPVYAAIAAKEHQSRLDVNRIVEILAMDALESGTATNDDLRRIEFFIRVAQELGRDGIGPEVLPLCKVALKTQGNPDVALVREIYEYHEAQREAATPAQYLRAMARL